MKRVHYNGANTIIKRDPEGGGKTRRTKLGALQIAAMNWAANPPEPLPLYPPNVEELRKTAKSPEAPTTPSKKSSKALKKKGNKGPKKKSIDPKELRERLKYKKVGTIRSWSAK